MSRATPAELSCMDGKTFVCKSNEALEDFFYENEDVLDTLEKLNAKVEVHFYCDKRRAYYRIVPQAGIYPEGITRDYQPGYRPFLMKLALRAVDRVL